MEPSKANPQKPFSQSCEENKEPILHVIGPLFAGARTLLEIGSGTGQHAVYFAAAMPHLRWQASDRRENLAGIRLWREEADLANLLPPLQVDVIGDAWPEQIYDGVFSANTAHIMSWDEVQAMFTGVARVLRPGGFFALYGPFNYGGRYTSHSNARFDAWLKAQDPRSSIKDFDALDALAQRLGLLLAADHTMPVNNRTLVWSRG
jgi:cyclopropane fatty-acyl-phospholipid synthase-like methyltransferase